MRRFVRQALLGASVAAVALSATAGAAWAQSPANVQANAVGATTVEITWEAGVRATGFRVQRAASSEGPWTSVTALPLPASATSFTDTRAPAGSEVCYQVQVTALVRARLESPGPACVTTPALGGGGVARPAARAPVAERMAPDEPARLNQPAPAAMARNVGRLEGDFETPVVTRFTATVAGLDAVDLAWTASAAAEGFTIQRVSPVALDTVGVACGHAGLSALRDRGLAAGHYVYHIIPCPDGASVSMNGGVGGSLVVGPAGPPVYDMAVLGLGASSDMGQYGHSWAVKLKNEGNAEVRQAGVRCSVGGVGLRSLSGGPTYTPGLEAPFSVVFDQFKGLADLYFSLGPGSHDGTCTVTIAQPSNVKDVDPGDNSLPVPFVLPPVSPPDLRPLEIRREACNSSLAQQQRLTGADACIVLLYRFDNPTPPTLLKGEWTIECTANGVTERKAGPAKLYTASNHTGIVRAVGFNGPAFIGAPSARPVTCRLDTGGAIAEANEANNELTASVTLP
ncbi:MAG: hypothetical protein ABR559_06975 [Gemmatimonadota bacterium]